MLPAASMMMAEGVISSLDDLEKPFVTINSFTNQIPGHAHLGKIGAIRNGDRIYIGAKSCRIELRIASVSKNCRRSSPK
jgi:dihydroxyacid dehydratase/phosphogluconate dehydratase